MTAAVEWSTSTRTLLLVVLTASFWVFLQDSCAQDQEVGPGPTIPLAVSSVQDNSVPHQHDRTIPISIKDDKRAESVETPSQSLKHASILLRRSANAIETNQELAVQLIRQVIAILKHQVIPSLLDHNSVLVPISSLSGLTEQGLDGEGPSGPVSD